MESDMLRIIFITNSIGFGGAEKMLTFVANSLSERGHICAIVNLGAVPEYVNVYKQNIDEHIDVFNVKDKVQQKKRKAEIKAVAQYAKEFHADVLIGFTNFPNMYATVVGKMLKIPSIISERGDPAITLPNTFKDRILKLIIDSASGGVFQTNGAKAYYGKRLQKRGSVIPNPIFIKGTVPNVPYEEHEKTVVSVGRIDNKQKRLDVMLQAFSIFSKKHPEYTLKIYGSGDDENLVRQWCADLNIQDQVKFMGVTRTPMQDISDAGMFLITSDYEGISNSLLEAMAVGLPCVSTNHTPGGARLLIADHENGLLAPMGDVDALAGAMCEFADNPELAQKCGNNARDVVNRFEPSRIIDLWEDYIEKLCR